MTKGYEKEKEKNNGRRRKGKELINEEKVKEHINRYSVFVRCAKTVFTENWDGHRSIHLVYNTELMWKKTLTWTSLFIRPSGYLSVPATTVNRVGPLT